MVKVNCLNPIANVGLNLLSDNYEITDDFNSANVALVRSAGMHELDMPEDLLAVARAGAGVNNIPLDKCAEQGIVVFNTPGANANGVKELFVCGMLLAARDIKGGMDWVKENSADENINKTMEKAKSKFAGTEIQGKKLGVIGLGAIGVLAANAGEALGMEVMGCDPYLSVNNALNLSRNVKIVKSNAEIFAECDYITVHVPALDSTKGMINKDTIAMMKDGVVVLNLSRDVLINDADMTEALASGKVKRYVTDFPNATILKAQNVIAMPHLGASTAESEDNCAVMAVKQIMEYVENGNIINSVNYPNCDMGVCNNAGRITINHKNVADIIGQFSAVMAEAGIAVAEMMNKSRGDFAYTMIDLDAAATTEVVDKLLAIEGVIKVRIVK